MERKMCILYDISNRSHCRFKCIVVVYTLHHIIYPNSYVQIVVESLPASSLRPDNLHTQNNIMFCLFLIPAILSSHRCRPFNMLANYVP
jgi:hypothetical protein